MIYHTRRSCQFLIIILTILGINLFILFKFLHFKLTELTINIQFKALKTCFLFLEVIVITPLPEKNFRNVNFQSINSVLLGSSPLQFFQEILVPCLPPSPPPCLHFWKFCLSPLFSLIPPQKYKKKSFPGVVVVVEVMVVVVAVVVVMLVVVIPPFIKGVGEDTMYNLNWLTFA